MNDIKLIPSLMCCDFNNYVKEIKNLELSNVDMFHCDVIDGCYANNYGLSINEIKICQHNTTLPIDIHLMVVEPFKKIPLFLDLNPKIIYFHYDAEENPLETINLLKENGIHAGLAINPEIEVKTVEHLLKYCDYVLLMTVHPGFSGQKYLEPGKKLEMLVDLKRKYNFKIVIDGGCSLEVIKNLSKRGADGFVLGSSVLFGKQRNYEDIIKEINNNIDSEMEAKYDI